MTRVEAIRPTDRAAGVDTIGAAWEAGRATWVVDPSASASRLVADSAGRLDRRVVDDLLATGRAVVDLPVPTDTAVVVTSSGTTGPPKVLALTTSSMDASADGAHARLGVDRHDRWLLALPLHHVAGQSVVWRSRRLGVEPVVQERLDVVAAGRAGVSIVSLVPTQLRRMVDAGARLDATVLLGGGAISPRLLEDTARGDHVRGVVRSYGLTETAGGCVYDGIPFDGVEVAAPDGRLRLRGPVLATGRVTPEGLAPVVDADGWLVTNDLGAVDARGVVSVVGRADDVVITGGVNVNPAAVEVVLEDHPGVARAGVVGLPDTRWGQRLVAAIVPVGATPADLETLRAVVRDHLGPPAVPKQFVVVDDLPLTGLGKVSRDRLAALVAARLRGRDSSV